MLKVKKQRTADCVAGGFRYERNSRLVGSLLLGLYNAICDKSQPPKMSPFGLASAGIAMTRTSASVCGNSTSDTIPLSLDPTCRDIA